MYKLRCDKKAETGKLTKNIFASLGFELATFWPLLPWFKLTSNPFGSVNRYHVRVRLELESLTSTASGTRSHAGGWSRWTGLAYWKEKLLFQLYNIPLALELKRTFKYLCSIGLTVHLHQGKAKISSHFRKKVPKEKCYGPSRMQTQSI